VATLWDRVDERVLAWVAALPPAFSSSEIHDFSPRPPEPFEPLPDLDTREVGESLRRLHEAGFISGESKHDSWWDLRLAPRGLVCLGEWPDIDLVASSITLHRVLLAVAEDAPEAERDVVTRAAGVLGRTVDGVVRDTLAEIAHEGGADLAT
jgi:hypothetical protein